jgi:hypothetical protein
MSTRRRVVMMNLRDVCLALNLDAGRLQVFAEELGDQQVLRWRRHSRGRALHMHPTVQQVSLTIVIMALISLWIMLRVEGGGSGQPT